MNDGTLTPPVSERDHVAGPEDAHVTLVEYGDYECPYCGMAQPIVKKAQHELGEQLRLVFRHFPLAEAHPHAQLSAQAAEAAGAQARFWEMHDMIFEHQDALEPEDIIGYAKSLGLDVAQLARDLERFAAVEAATAELGNGSVALAGGTDLVPLLRDRIVKAETLVDLSRVVIGHADSNPSPDSHHAIVERGASVEFDFLGMSFTPLERHGEGRIVESICELLSRGRVGQVLLSQDVCHDSQLKRYGGNGYVYLADTFLPRLRAAGVRDDEIRTMTVDNPRRLLTIG